MQIINPLPMNKYNRYVKFRQETYPLLGNAKDATFELMDSVMTTKHADCLGEFSLSPFFRRKWSSTYEAIQDCRPSRNNLMKRYVEEIPKSDYVLLGIDHTVWEFKDAKTMKDRGYQYSASAQNGSVLGQGYSTIVWLPKGEGSWALPLRHERITSFETPISKATWQLKQVCQDIEQKVLVVLDCEYGNSSWVNQTADIRASKLMRIRLNSCLYAEPEAYGGKGRPKKHGSKFRINDESTYLPEDKIVEVNDEKLGLIRISQWNELHFKTACNQKLNLIKVERLNPKKTGKEHRHLWLIWVGEQFLPLEKVWSQYARRFGIEHWYRFAKQRLHWTLPSLSTPVQCERWSDLMPLMTWQLWLAKDLVADHYLPWQKPQTNLTPERVAQSLFLLLVDIDSPAQPPKTRGKSPGWEKGLQRSRRKSYPTVKKRLSRQVNSQKRVI